MRRFLPDRTTWASAISGLLMACAFPLPDLPWLAWLALVPLILVMPRRPFKSGFVAGLVFFAVTLYWLNIVMTTYGHLPLVVSVFLALLLCAYLALYWGTATWAASRLLEFRDYPVAMTLPVLWVGLEFARAYLLTGFPWATLGYSQQAWLPMIQSAALILIGLNTGYGFWRLGQDLEHRDTTLDVALIQGNIPQELKWRPENQLKTVRTYRDLSLRAERAGAKDLIIWPEAAVPFYFQDGGILSTMVTKLPVETGVSLLFGSPAYQRDPSGIRYLNSTFLLSPAGQVQGRSDKVHLVPFGEYVPLDRLLPFVDKIVVGIGDFSPGTINPLALKDHRLGVLVCYEVIFPELARDYVNQGSDLLVNVTNDAWFGDSSAPWQHLAMARFRAIENRVWLARAANTGVTALIAPSGRIVDQTDLFVPAYLPGQIGLGARPGLYAHMGDLVPGLFLVISILWLLQTRRRLQG
ncbi:MAG: apolipoprotein N-acyltransferase [Desulfuromonadales bacterium]